MSMLKLENVNVFYGGIHALRNVSLSVNAGEVVTLIGSNGAGKSTTLRARTSSGCRRTGWSGRGFRWPRRAAASSPT